MNTRRNEEIIVAADVGTSKVCVIVGRRTADDLEVIGFGMNESRGLRVGEVVSMEQTAQCLANALEEAELMARVPITSVYMGVSAGHVRGRASTGAAQVRGPVVTEEDMAAALDSARVGRTEGGRVLLHTLAREWVVDRRDGLVRPQGMPGARLEARVHLVTASETAIASLVRCASLCNVELRGVVLDTLASSSAVLTDTEKEMGCVLVDIGGGTTDVAVWADGALVHTTVIPLGGDALTNDTGIAFRVTRDVAERLKRHHGSALTDEVAADDTFTVPGGFDRPPHRVSRKLLATVLEPRLDEILRHVRREVELSGYPDALRAGYVMTGGTASMHGALTLARRTLNAPVRLGIPFGVGGMVDVVRHPKFAAAVGLLRYAASEESVEQIFEVGPRSLSTRIRATVTDLIRRML